MSNNMVVATTLLVAAQLVQAQDSELRTFQPQDVHRIADVDDIAISPDGDWVAYKVTTTNIDKDEYPSDLYMVSWDGSERIRLTHTEDSSESHPRFSPDGRYLAFIAARSDGSGEDSDDPKAKSQIWLLNRAGGEAERLTEMPGGVSRFEWSPDSTRLVIASRDPEEDPEEDGAGEEEDGTSHETPDPIVIDRYQFKQDRTGFLTDRYQRLYVFDVANREATLLTPGPYDNNNPVWSPDGETIAFSSRRQGDPDRHRNSDIYLIDAVEGAEPRQLTTWEGPDSSPVFSPDGRRIAYLQGGPEKYSGYDPDVLAVIPVDGGDPLLLTGDLDRHVSSPRWSGNGRSIYFLLTDDRLRQVARISTRGGDIRRLYPTRQAPGVASSIEVGANGVAAVASFGQQPAEVYRADDGSALTDHNATLVAEIDWATVEGFDATGEDGVLVGSMLLKPPGYRPGVAYPTIALIHGGPVSQDGYDFDSMSQVLAAQGYLVVNPNYRGSNGRGRDFARAIYAKWGTLEIQDIHTVMDALVEQGLADPDRLGIGGWSYGGINTNFAIASDTRFAAAYSGSSASNWIAGYGTDQYIWQYENEIGLPWESIDAYLEMSYPFLHADRIETPTLFMCGEADFNVPLINSEQMYQALRSLDVPTQLVIYPGEYHGLSKPSYIQDRLERIVDWYDRYLGSGSP